MTSFQKQFEQLYGTPATSIPVNLDANPKHNLIENNAKSKAWIYVGGAIVCIGLVMFIVKRNSNKDKKKNNAQ